MTNLMLMQDIITYMQADRIAEAEAERIRRQLPPRPSARSQHRIAPLVAALTCIVLVAATTLVGAGSHAGA